MPDPWTYEHEAEVPECFRDPTAVKRPPPLSSAASHQD
jgi:hypothetical protein